MSPLDPSAAEYVRSWLGGPRGPGLLDLHQALADHRRGLWGDEAREPRSVLLVREGDGQLEVFGAGEVEPALGWLWRRAGAGQAVALAAPRAWWDAVEHRVGAVERAEVMILSVTADDFRPDSSAVAPRRLSAEDSEVVFASEAAPRWALAGWGSFGDLIEHGAAFAVSAGREAAALAWVYSRASGYEAVGVSTAPRFRRLGLGRAVASALVSEILHRRGRIPLWTTTPQNAPSQALARSLGFSIAGTETLLRWRSEGSP